MTNAQTIDYDKLKRQVDAHPYPLLFATISGAHLYGFPSPGSDFDLRGAHLEPALFFTFPSSQLTTNF